MHSRAFPYETEMYNPHLRTVVHGKLGKEISALEWDYTMQLFPTQLH
jgi:hypothetical protein